ncbi:unnamed protein product, partial [Tenebrio molitor]
MPAIVCNANFSTTHLLKKTELDSECLYLELAAKLQTEKLPGGEKMRLNRD